jgi:hypothetical protein
MGLRRACPEGHGGIIHVGELQWDYETQPTPISRVYKIRIRYQLEKSPKIFVIAPNLRDLADGRKIPHLYDQALQRLCLYLPRTGEWNATKWLANTVIPWVNLWLYYFEDWLQTNEWRGGGEHPPEDQKTKKRKRTERRKSI